MQPAKSTWAFETSESGEFDALVFAASKGSFYVKDSRDKDGILHELLYVGLGVTTSKGPIPFGIGGSFSTPEMFSEGVGNIGMKPSKSSLELSDFGGTGLILSGNCSIGFLPGVDAPDGAAAEIIFFGAPPLFTVAIGVMISKQWQAPGAGITAMPCIFTVDP